MRILGLVFLVFLCGAAVAENQHASARLLVDRTTVAAGESFLVGVLFEIDPEWHIYWKNPGDAGMATSIKWSLPDGFVVSELLWPVPKRFMQEGDIEGFGYEGSAMLMARVTPPADFTGQAPIGAVVRWLACKSICVPGRASLTTEVRVGSSSVPANQETFSQWLRRVPMDLGQSPLQVSVRRSGMSYELTVAGVPKEADLEVFVSPPEGVAVRRVQRKGNTAVVEFARLAGSPVRGSAEVVIGNKGTHARVVLPLE